MSGPATPTPTSTPITHGTPTPTPSPTPTPTGAPTATPTATPSAGASVAGCLAGVFPTEAFNAIGAPHTFTFACGNFASTLTVPAAALPTPTPPPTGSVPPGVAPAPGCYDVSASVTDTTTGSTVTIDSAFCANSPASLSGGAVNCAPVTNPICAAGFQPSSSGQCFPCPPGFSFSVGDSLCHTPPVGFPLVCPAGTTPILNGATPPTPVDCTKPPFPPSPTAVNEVTVTINPGAPHTYRIDFSGFVGTGPFGTCPPGTTPASNVNFAPPSGVPPITGQLTGPGCAFSVSAFKKYVEGTSLEIIPGSNCGGSIPTGQPSEFGGQACFFIVRAAGIVILKTGVNCSDGSEPATGTPAPAFSDELDGEVNPEVGDDGGLPPLVPVYDCSNGSLEVKNIPVPNISITLTATNGVFNPNCIPSDRFPQPTPTPVIGTPTPTPSPTPTATPTPTPPGPTLTPTPFPTPTGFTNPALCFPTGSPTGVVVTNEDGLAGAIGETATVIAHATPPADKFSNFTVDGVFLIDGVGVPGLRMFSTSFFLSGNLFCDSGITDGSGSASCTRLSALTTPGEVVPVKVSFIFNCQEYGTFTFMIVGNEAVPASIVNIPVQNGICLLRSGFGPITVTAHFTSTINTQPSISVGPVVLGQYGVATATPVGGPSTPGPSLATPTNTPVATPTPTNTPIPTPTNTPTKTPTPTVTPTVTPTPVPPLLFSLDAARVAQVNNRGDKKGLDVVRPGQKAWLMLYYTVRSVPRTLPRVDTYQIQSGARTIFKIAFKDKQTTKDLGSKVKYTVITFALNLPAGVYNFKGTLSIGGISQSRMWRFALLKTVSTAAARRDVVVAQVS